MEPFAGWERGPGYKEKKIERSEKLYEALEVIIPDIRKRVVLELIASPLSHQKWLRRYKRDLWCSYPRTRHVSGPADRRIRACIESETRVRPEWACLPAASSGVIVANTLVGISKTL